MVHRAEMEEQGRSVAYQKDYGYDMNKMPRFVAPPGTIRCNNRGNTVTRWAQYVVAKKKTQQKKEKAKELREKMKAKEWGEYGQGDNKEEDKDEEEQEEEDGH